MVARRVGIMGLLLCLCLCLMPCNAQAASTAEATESIVPEMECVLNLFYTDDGTVFADVPVKLYQVATVSADAQYSLASPFLTSGLDLNGIQAVGEWDAIRSTLEAHILANAVEADFTAVTNQDGVVAFETLESGLYLAIAENVVLDGVQYSFYSAIVALPGLDAEGVWQYHVAVTSKFEFTPPTAPDEEIQLKVLKLWKDENRQAERQERIETEIFRDGKSYQIVTLSEENQWSYAWTAEADGSDWLVVERNVPAGYTVTVEERGTTFILTNTLLPKEPSAEEVPPKEKVPQTDGPKTGDTPHILLYTVLMYVTGIGLVLLGITGKRKRT